MPPSLNDLFHLQGVSPEDVSLIFHMTQAQPFRDMLPYLARERRDLLDAYQAVHSDRAAASLKKRPLAATFLPLRGDRMLFEGLYRVSSFAQRTTKEIYANPAYAEIEQVYGDVATAPARNIAQRLSQDFFDLEPLPEMSDLRGRLVVPAPAGRTYVRLAENLNAPVLGLFEESKFVAPPPDWDRFIVKSGLLRSLPSEWSERLRGWRGVYLIVDQTDGARYVGSAYGRDNLWGRWIEHTRQEQGATKELKFRDPANFRFSILQLISPTATVEETVACENSWKQRLDTIANGLNSQ